MYSNDPEDYTHEALQEEIERGGRLVIYVYCISALIITFKRHTRVYLIKGGKSPVVPGLPWALLTLLCGWWGFPWGLIYTPEALFKTLGGGVDLTDAWFSDDAARQAARQEPPPLSQNGPSQSTQGVKPPVQPTSFREEVPPTPASRFKKPAIIVGSLAAVALLVYVVAGLVMYNKNTVTFLNGLDQAYKVTLNGKTYDCKPGVSILHYKLPGGSYEMSATLPTAEAPVVKEQLQLGARSFWTWPTGLDRVTIINPDKLAIVYHATMKYRKVQPNKTVRPNSKPKDDDTAILLYANHVVTQMQRPDYYFLKAPKTIRVEASDRWVRTEVGAIDVRDAGSALGALVEYCDKEVLAEYVGQLRHLRPEVFKEEPASE